MERLANMWAHLCEPLALLAVGLSVAALASWQYYARVHSYWRRRGVQGERPFPLVGELISVLFRDRVQLSLERVRKLGKLHGIFFVGKPRLVVADAEVLRQICIKDFDVFPNHHANEWANKFQRKFLVFLQGDQWKRTRAIMSPQFTSGKIKRMYRLLDGCAEDLLQNLREQLIEARRDGRRAARVDLYALYSLYTMDGITTCCYGLRLERERGHSDLGRASARNALVRDCNQVFAFRPLRLAMLALLPKFVLRALHFRLASEREFMPLVRRVERLVARRRQAGASQKYDDLLQMLVGAQLDDELELNELDEAENHHAGLTHESLLEDQARLRSSTGKAAEAGTGTGTGAETETQSETELETEAARDATTKTTKTTKTNAKTSQPAKRVALQMGDLEILSESLLLLAAGLDTTRSSMSTTTYLLAHHPEVQERLYQELAKIARYEETPVGRHLRFDYDALTSCQYLDAVISEGLRYLGPVIYTDRVAERDYRIEKFNLLVRKGDQLMLGLHPVAHDPDYWQRPHCFEPERFLPGRKEHIVPGSYLPFGMGPRHCIGMRFSLTEAKLGLAKVLMNYKFAPAPGADFPPKPARGLGLVRIANCHALATYRDEANY